MPKTIQTQDARDWDREPHCQILMLCLRTESFITSDKADMRADVDELHRAGLIEYEDKTIAATIVGTEAQAFVSQYLEFQPGWLVQAKLTDEGRIIALSVLTSGRLCDLLVQGVDKPTGEAIIAELGKRKQEVDDRFHMDEDIKARSRQVLSLGREKLEELPRLFDRG
jgi:hypothetical protein